MLDSQSKLDIIRQSMAGQLDVPAYEAINREEAQTGEAIQEQGEQQQEMPQAPEPAPVAPPAAQTIPQINTPREEFVSPNTSEIGLNQTMGSRRSEMIQPGQYQDGGKRQTYKEWKDALPENLRDTDTSTYNLEGAFNAGLEPTWNHEDKKYHLNTVDPTSGAFLKSKAHPTTYKETDWFKGNSFDMMNPETPTPQTHKIVTDPKGHFGEDQLQYVRIEDFVGPSEYKTGGKVTKFKNGGEHDPPKKKYPSYTGPEYDPYEDLSFDSDNTSVNNYTLNALKEQKTNTGNLIYQDNSVQTAAEWSPITGEIMDAGHIVNDLSKGNYGDAALSAAGFMIPFVPGTAVKKFVKPLIKPLTDKVGNLTKRWSRYRNDIKIGDTMPEIEPDIYSSHADMDMIPTQRGKGMSTKEAIELRKKNIEISPGLKDSKPELYFHGTNSGSFAGIKANDGLVPAGKINTGLHSGERGHFWGNHANTTGISTTRFDETRTPMRYSGAHGPQSVNSPLNDYNSFIDGKANFVSRHGDEVYEAMRKSKENSLSHWNNATPFEKDMIENPYPAIFGINPKTRKHLDTRNINSDIRLEQTINSSLGFDELANMYVPKSKMEAASKYFDGKMHIRDLEDLAKIDGRHGMDMYKWKRYGGFKYENGGLKYENGGPTDPPKKKKLITYNTLKGDRRSFTGDQSKDDYINKQLLTGKFGYDESAGGLVRLDTPINVSKEDQELGRRRDVPVGVSTEQIAQSYIDGTNQSEEARNAYINYGFDKTINNPAFQAAAYFTPPGALIGAAGAAARMPNAINEFTDDPSLKTGVNLGLNTLMMTPIGRAAGVRFSPLRDAKSFYKGFKGALDRAKTSKTPTDYYGFTDLYNTPRLKSPINIPKPTSPFTTTNKFNIKIPEGLGSIDDVTGKVRPTTANLLSPSARDHMIKEYSRDLDKMESAFDKNKEAGWQKFQEEIVKLNRKESYKPIAETRERLLKEGENMPQRYADMNQLPEYIKDNYQYVGFLWEKGLIGANVNKEQLNKLKDNKELVDEYADRQMRSVRGVYLDADEAVKAGGTEEQMADQYLFAQPSLPQDKIPLIAGRGQLGRGVYTSNSPGLANRFSGRSSWDRKGYVGDMSIVKPGELEGKSPSEIVDFFDRIGRNAEMLEPVTGKTYANLNRQKDDRFDFGKAMKARLEGKEYNPENPIISDPDLPEGYGLFDTRTGKQISPDLRYIYRGYNTTVGDTPGQVATERVIIRPQNITPGEKYEQLEGEVFDPTKLGRASGIRGEAADPKYFSNWDQLYKELVSGGYVPEGEKYKNFITDLANLQRQTDKYGRNETEAINNIKNKIVNSSTFIDDLMPKMKSDDTFTDAVAESIYYGSKAPEKPITSRQDYLDKREGMQNSAWHNQKLGFTNISEEFSPTLSYLESLNRPFAKGAVNPLVDKNILLKSHGTALGDIHLDNTAGLRSRFTGLFEASLPDINAALSRNPFYESSPSVLGAAPTRQGLLSTFPDKAITTEAGKSGSFEDQSVKDDLEYLKQSTHTPTYVRTPSDDILSSPTKNKDVLRYPHEPRRDFKTTNLESFKKRLNDSAELARFYADPLNVPAPKAFLGQFEPSQVMGITGDITGKPFTNVADLEKDVKDILNYDRLEFDEQKARFGNIGTRDDFLTRRMDLQNALSGRGSMYNLVPPKFREDPLDDLPPESSQSFYTAVMGDKLMESTQVGKEFLDTQFPLLRRDERLKKFLDWGEGQKDFQRIFYPQQRILKKYGGKVTKLKKKKK